MPAFLALTLPDDIRRSLAVLQQELAHSGADIKWVEPQNLHVTLKFLGEVTDEQRLAVERLLGEAARGETAFTPYHGGRPARQGGEEWRGRPEGSFQRPRPLGRGTGFTLGLDRVGAFPSIASPRVVWVGLGEGKERAVRIAERIEESCGSLGLPKEDRSFAAHVTLGRVRTPRRQAELARALRECAWRAPAPWPVTALTLYQSVLSSRGPNYTVLAEVPLTR